MRRLLPAIALLVTACVQAPGAQVTTFDGEYTGRARWVQCPSAGFLTMQVEKGNAWMLANRATRLTFEGPIKEDGTVFLTGINNSGYRGMTLVGRISGDQFDGRTWGLMCDFEVSMKKAAN
jgi:hypothetical protein